MSFRGRGRGRGFGRGAPTFYYAKQVPFVPFPETELPDRNNIPEEKELIIWNLRLQNFWKSSPYYLEDSVSKKNEFVDIERFSDWGKPKRTSKRDSLNQFLQLTCDNFPRELVGGSRRGQPNPKKVRWTPDSDLQKLDLLEKLEKGREEKDGTEKEKEGEDEVENEDGAVDEELSDDGDYNQNVDFDDDEDDFNMDDGGDDEATY